MAVADAAIGAAARIGPYFSVTSFLPAVLVAAAVAPLILARPWSGEPHWSQVAQALQEVTIAQAGAFLASALLIALLLHPLQYALVQLMEGYWGTRRLPMGLSRARILYHAEVRRRLKLLANQSLAAAQRSGEDLQEELRHLAAYREAHRLQRRYPDELEDVVPTVLGNILRRYERGAGQPYGLDIITAAPHLLLVAGPDDAAYVRDQRTQLDLATRLSASCFVVGLLSAVLLAPCGWWLLLAAIPYLLSQLFYRGACTVAHEYGVSLQTLIDLNRLELYARMGLDPPASLAAERTRNELLNRILTDRDPDVRMRLTRPTTPPPA